MMTLEEPTVNFRAGASEVDITPQKPTFLWGYPRTPRQSTGVHDALKCSALLFEHQNARLLFLSTDLIFVPKSVVVQVRQRLSASLPIQPEQIMVTASHTHSGPMTVRYLSNESDPYVPEKVDQKYMTWLTDQLILAGIHAYQGVRPAELAQATADARGIGTHRHDPHGPADVSVPAWLVRDVHNQKTLALMAICAMHPTVLHEDSTLISGDFPGLARQALRDSGFLPPEAPFVYHMGASGNQSPRYVTQGNTIEEAKRLGGILARAIEAAFESPQWIVQPQLLAGVESFPLQLRKFPELAQAQVRKKDAEIRYHHLKTSGASRPELRTAECDLFGAEELVCLAQAAASGRIEQLAHTYNPAEIQVFRLGENWIVGWPGEHFVEFALQLRRHLPNATLITLANGELQGYIVTNEAVERGWYEAGNALFAPENAQRFFTTTLQLVQRMGAKL
jgi:hypothetical protein